MATKKKPNSKEAKSSAPKRDAKKTAAPKKIKSVAKKSETASKPAKAQTAKTAASKKTVNTSDQAKTKAAKPAKAATVKNTEIKSSPAATKAPVNISNGTKPSAPPEPGKLTPFFKKQHQRLLALRDSLLDSMNGVARDTLRSRADGSEASAFGMHQADAGSEAYDREFALNLLSQEHDALYEIDEAIKRLAVGEYGVCEMSGKNIPRMRLEAIPFARLTVECQSQIEKQNKLSRNRQPVTSLFGLTDGEGRDSDDDDSSSDKD